MAGIFSKPKMPAMPTPPDEDSAAKPQAEIDAKRRAATAKGPSGSLLGGEMDTQRTTIKRLLGE